METWMKVKSPIILTMLLSSTFPVLAVPNMWSSGFGQGNAEYTITSTDNVAFTINCTGNPDKDGILEHGVAVTLANGTTVYPRDQDPNIVVVMNDQQYWIPPSLGWRNADNAWVSFIGDIAKAQSFDVYINDKKVSTYLVNLKNAQKVLPQEGECTEIYYR